MLWTRIESYQAFSTAREAILLKLRTPELHCDTYGCTIGGLMDFLGPFAGRTWFELFKLLDEGLVLVHTPLEELTTDSYVHIVKWTYGSTTSDEIIARYGDAHARKESEDGIILSYDVQFGRELDLDSPPPAPYPEREAADPDRPKWLNFPFSSVLGSEALQIHFHFDREGLLRQHVFSVGQAFS